MRLFFLLEKFLWYCKGYGKGIYITTQQKRRITTQTAASDVNPKTRGFLLGLPEADAGLRGRLDDQALRAKARRRCLFVLRCPNRAPLSI